MDRLFPLRKCCRLALLLGTFALAGAVGCHPIDDRNAWGHQTRSLNQVFRADNRDDRKVIYRDLGRKDTGTTLLFVHGMGSSKMVWYEVTPALEAGHRVITIDLLGHGDSDKPLHDVSYSMGYQASIVRQLILELGLSNVVLVGHSYGGGTVLEAARSFVGTGNAHTNLAADGRPIIMGLVLVAPSAVWFPKPDTLHLAQGASCSLLEALFSKDAATRIVVESSYWDKKRVKEEFVAEYKRIYRDDAAAIVFARISDHHLWPELAARKPHEARYTRLACPVLLVWGEHDPIVPRSVLERLETLLPNRRRVLIPACGHSPPTEQPAALTSAIGQFVGELGGNGTMPTDGAVETLTPVERAN